VCRRGLELQPRRTPLHPHLSPSSRPWCRMGEGTLRRPHLLRPAPSATAAPQQASPEPLGSRGPPVLSQKAPPPVMRLEVCRVVPPEVVAHVEMPADQWANGRCSSMRYGECEPSIIEKEKSMRQ
jgi:hypothetical protein